MPQASDALHRVINQFFPDVPYGQDSAAMDFLLTCGFTFDQSGYIHKPTRSHSPTHEQWACIQYLCDEWDFGFRDEPPYDY